MSLLLICQLVQKNAAKSWYFFLLICTCNFLSRHLFKCPLESKNSKVSKFWNLKLLTCEMSKLQKLRNTQIYESRWLGNFEADLNSGYLFWVKKGGRNSIWFDTNCSDDNVWQIWPRDDCGMTPPHMAAKNGCWNWKTDRNLSTDKNDTSLLLVSYQQFAQKIGFESLKVSWTLNLTIVWFENIPRACWLSD